MGKLVPATWVAENGRMTAGGGFDKAAAVSVKPLAENSMLPSDSSSRVPVSLV